MRIFTILVAAGVAFAASASGSDGPLLTPSQLNAQPDKYNGKLVRVQGSAAIGFAKSCLVDDHRNYATLSGDHASVTLVSGSHSFETGKKYNGQTVVVSGVFKKDFFRAPYGGANVTRFACSTSAIDLAGQQEPQITQASK
jgi:hypothetical protein